MSSVLPPLLVEAENVASALYQGLHGRRRAGIGETFWQFRDYNPGDDAARIDWRQSARGDRLYIREREWEAAQSLYLWADNSGSMHYASHKSHPAKNHRAHVLMLALADLLLRGGEKVVWLGAAPIAVHGATGLQRIAARLDLDHAAPSLPPDMNYAHHAHMILCSDFLMPQAALHERMQRYAALNLRGALVHVLDAAEESLPFDGRVELLGMEGEAPLIIPNAAALREAYRARMEEHKARLRTLAASAGWYYLPHVTAAPPAVTLLQLFERFAANRRSA